VETPRVTEEFFVVRVYHEHKGNTIMNTLHLTSILLLLSLLLTTLFASSVKMFFTEDELDEMGVRIGPSEIEKGGMLV
jgi:hypothetical protein